MEDLNDKVTGSTLTAAEWNQVPSEIQNVIEGLGQTLSSGDLDQLGKAISGYVANGTFYTDSGAADAYVLTTIGSKQSSTAYTDGLEAEFIIGNTNTGASTINVATLGVVDIAGTSTAGTLTATETVRLRFNLSTGDFDIVNNTGDTADFSGHVVQMVSTTSDTDATTTTTMPFDNTIPQNTEGGEFMTLAITPKFSTSTLIIIVDAYVAGSTSVVVSGAIFKDTDADAIYATATQQVNIGNTPTPMKMTAPIAAVDTAARTYKFRAGLTSAGTLTFNGASGSSRFSTVPAASIVIMEVAV